MSEQYRIGEEGEIQEKVFGIGRLVHEDFMEYLKAHNLKLNLDSGRA